MIHLRDTCYNNLRSLPWRNHPKRGMLCHGLWSTGVQAILRGMAQMAACFLRVLPTLQAEVATKDIESARCICPHTSESISWDFERRVLGRYSELQVGRPRGIRKTVRTSTPGLSLRVCDCLECHVVQQNTIRNDMERQLTSVSGCHHQFVDNTPGHTHAHNRTAFGCPDI